MRQPLVVVYDVQRDTTRARVASELRRYGALWVQQSAWVLAPVARLDPARLVGALAQGLIGGDRLWAYEPCTGCQRRARFLPELAPRLQPFKVVPVTLRLPPDAATEGGQWDACTFPAGT